MTVSTAPDVRPAAAGARRAPGNQRRPVLVLNDVTKTYPNGRDAL
ncbi:MAG: hypothetical protein QOI92_1700, partial [Chloroflexota bacterium]|nr:hypothetical protein [Chloroflexota bacterium]